MFLKKISLTNFRNYDNLDLEFDKNINIFIGNNAQGKTNILESIYVLSISKSHRINKDLFLIKDNCLFTKIHGEIINYDKLNEFEILINKKGKRVSINSNPFRKISEYLSNINTIMFCPDDLEIIKGTPSERRYFLNSSLSQFYSDYSLKLSKYNKLLKNRNEYLKNTEKIDKIYLKILTDKLINLNVDLIIYRRNYINEINKYIVKIYKNLTNKDKISIKYDSFINNDINEKNIKQEIQEKFDRVLENEIFQRTTLLGIHKDDFSIYIDDVKINNYGSQGQQRISILCLKLAEIDIYKEKFNKKPIILLDDIFSELDSEKKENIIKYINSDMQVFITSTDLTNIDEKITKNADIFYVNDGKDIKR